MGETGPENEVEFKHRLSREFLDRILAEKGLNPDEFYALAAKLNEVPFLHDARPEIDKYENGMWTDLIITARYDGPEQRIGDEKVRKEGGSYGPPDEVQAAVERIFEDLGQRTGFKFHKPRANETSHAENNCSALALVGEPEKLKTLGYGQKLEVRLYRE